MKRIGTIILSVLALMMIQGIATASVRTIPKDMTVVQQWGFSKHYGANVGCYECHQADEGDPDAYMHQKQLISIIVSPKDCANCHESAVKEMTESHHAKAARILGSLDNLLAEVIEGNSSFITPGFPEGNSAAAVNGCWQCHGSQVKPHGPIQVSAASTRTAQRAPARPAIPGMHFPLNRHVTPRTVASAIWVRIIRRLKSMKSPSMA